MPDATPTTEKKPRKRATASDTKLKPATKKAAKATRKARRAPPRTAPARRPFDVLALRRALGHGIPVARPVLAKLLRVHVNTIANLEHGSVPTEKTRKKLEEVAAKAATGKLAIPTPKKAAAPGKAGKKAAVAPQKPSKGKTASGSIDVAALRAKLGLSRARLARLLGAVPESVRLWENGRPPSEKFVAKLRSLAAQRAKVTVPASVGTDRAPKRGRPPGRPARGAQIVGDVPIVYADVVSVTKNSETARIRFGLIVPGERGAPCVADVVVCGGALAKVGTRASP